MLLVSLLWHELERSDLASDHGDGIIALHSIGCDRRTDMKLANGTGIACLASNIFREGFPMGYGMRNNCNVALNNPSTSMNNTLDKLVLDIIIQTVVVVCLCVYLVL